MLSEERKWLAVSGGAAIAAVAATLFVMQKGLESTTGRKPPLRRKRIGRKRVG